jgi:sporulation protein YqfC
MKSQFSNQKNESKKSERVVTALELPKDLFLGMPLLSMEGDRTLCITNHRGIVRYSSESIVVATSKGSIEIVGQSLLLTRFSKDIIELSGVIKSVSFLL